MYTKSSIFSWFFNLNFLESNLNRYTFCLDNPKIKIRAFSFQEVKLYKAYVKQLCHFLPPPIQKIYLEHFQNCV